VLRTSGFHLLFILPKSSFGMDKNADFIFSSSFQNLRLGSINFVKQVVTFILVIIISFIFVKFYPSQTKILEGWTNISECVFEALFKDVSTRFGLHNVEKCFENEL